VPQNPNDTVFCHLIGEEARDGQVRVERNGKFYWKQCTAWEEGACGRMCAKNPEDRTGGNDIFLEDGRRR